MDIEHPGNGRDSPERKSRLRWRRAAENTIGAPTLGYIPPSPASPAPTLADPRGEAAAAYVQALDRLQAATAAQVLLVSDADKGPGATLAALNLGITATRAGLRTVIIDGDPTGGGISRYLRTGDGPGLAELASGAANLAEASRLLTIDAANRLPIIPAGTVDVEAEIEPAHLADPIDRISEHSDLVLIVAPASVSVERGAALGAHADGSILIVDGTESQRTVADAAERLTSIGAPVIGLIELVRVGKRKRSWSRRN